MTTRNVTLSTPVKRTGDQNDVAAVALRKPQPGEMRGLKLLDVLQLDVNALLVLLPRITDPALTRDEVATMELDDLLKLGGEVTQFFGGADTGPFPTT